MARPVLRTTARGKQGPPGPQGERGPQGLPATGAAEDDAAIAAFATTPGTATYSALTEAIGAHPGGHRYVTAWQPGSPPPLLADKTRLLVKGSSSEYGLAQNLASIVASDAPTWDLTVINRAQGGQQWQHMAAQDDTVRATLTFPGNTIPASGTATVTTSLPANWGMRPFKGHAAGVAGTLTRTGSNAYTFTRDTPGDAVAVGGAVPFVPDQYDPDGILRYRDCAVVVPLAKNSASLDNIEVVKAWVDVQIEWQIAKHGFVFINGLFADTGASSSQKAYVNALNAYAAAAAAQRDRVWFFDVGGYLTGSQVWIDTGITPDSTDLAQQAAGTKPHSLSGDAQHMNGAAYQAVIRHVWLPVLAEAFGYEPVAPPDVESDLLLDYDPEALTASIVDGGDATNITPAAGSKTTALNSVSGTAPKLIHDALNDRAVLQFGGNGSIRNSSALGVSGPVTIGLVFRKTSASSQSEFIYASHTTSGQRLTMSDTAPSTLGIALGASDEADKFSSGFESSEAGWAVVFAVYNGDKSLIAVNGGAADAIGVFAELTQWDWLRLGAATGTTNQLTGEVARFKVWNRALTTADREEQYGLWQAEYALA